MQTKEGKPLKYVVEIERAKPVEKTKAVRAERYKTYWKWKGGKK